MSKRYYRIVSGTMRVLLWETGFRRAIRHARAYRNWRNLGLLTKFQWKLKTGDWSPWYYVKTHTKP